MKTKIVYVVTSSPEDYYLEQTLLSIFSVIKHNRGVEIELVVDDKTDTTITNNRTAILKYINKKVVVKVPEKYNKVQASRYMKTSLRKHVQGDYLFIDSDTIITESLSSIDQYNDDIMAVINEHVPISQYFDSYGKRVKKYALQEGWNCSDAIQYFNSGVMYVKDTELSRRFYSDWHATWSNNVEKYGRHFDQPPLALTNEKYGYIIKELPAIWNCQILRFGLPYLNDAKIIHYFAAMKSKNDIVYIFRDSGIYNYIKTNGCLSDEILHQIDKAKFAFVNPTRVCNGSELSLLSGEMALFCVQHPSVTNILNIIFRLLVTIIKFFKSK